MAELAALVKAKGPALNAREAYLAFVLEGMPKFRDVKRLDLWETAYQAVGNEEPASPTEQLLRDIFELGWFNLYGAFSPDGTRKYFDELCSRFAKAGLRVNSDSNVSDW